MNASTGVRANGGGGRRLGDRERRSPFDRLQAQARRLQRLMVLLVAVVALLPPTVYAILALGQLARETERHAHHLALLVTANGERPGAAVARLEALLMRPGALAGLAAVTVRDGTGAVALRVGEGRALLTQASVAIPLPAAAAPLASLEATPDDVPLVRQGLRVLLIHIAVAAVLAVAVYRLPMGSLRHAIEEVEATHVRLVHSAKLVAIGETYAGLAHEINNPLGIMLSRVRLMLAAPERRHGDALVGDLETIDRHGQRIANTVRSLLQFSRKTAFELDATDLNGVVADVVAHVERPFAAQGVRVTTSLGAPLPTIRGSRDHLQQVLLNLLTNARDAMPGGGTVTVRTRAGDGVVVAEVEDSGIGMAADVQARVFEPFFTTKREGLGTGLGLSVSHSIVTAHGGEIDVESEEGRGTRFQIRLPVPGAQA